MKKRKPLRISEFDYRQNGAYFITLCTKKRVQCLGHVVGADAHIGPHTALTEWGKVVETFLLTIPGLDAYVIMPNHVHMIVRIEPEGGPMWASAPTQSLSDRIRSFKILVSKKIGVSIWQRSFYDHVIRCEDDYLRIRQYIDGNPSKWAEDEYYFAE